MGRGDGVPGTHPWTTLPRLVDRLDTCLAGAVEQATLRFGFGPGADPYRGLYVGDDEVRRLLAGSLDEGTAVDQSWPGLIGPETDDELDPFDTAVLMLAVAPEVDLKYERVYAYLQDDVNRRRPSVALALDLFCADFEARVQARERFAPDAPLRARHRLELMGGDADPLLGRAIRADPQWVRHLLGGTGLDEQVATATEHVEPSIPVEHLPLPAALGAMLAACVNDVRAGRPTRLCLLGDDIDVLSSIAAGVASSVPMPLLRTRSGHPLDATALARIEADCRMLDRALHLTEPPDRVEVGSDHAPLVIVTTSDAEVRTRLAAAGYRSAEVPRPDDELRRRWWSIAAADTNADEDDLDRLAVRYHLTATQIRSVVAIAGSHRGSDAVRPGAGTDVDALTAAARTVAAAPLDGQAQRVPRTATWADLVLPDLAMRHLRDLCDRVIHRPQVLDRWGMGTRTAGRRGVNALFAGASGTGKTMAAEVIAGELGLDLYAIDLSAVVSKYIGETEKNLDRIFDAAEHARRRPVLRRGGRAVRQAHRR